MKSRTMIEFAGWGGNAESNGIKRHPEPKAKDPIKKQVDSSVASLLQNDVQGAWEFFGLCAQNDKAAQGDSSDFAFGMTRQSGEILRAFAFRMT